MYKIVFHLVCLVVVTCRSKPGNFKRHHHKKLGQTTTTEPLVITTPAFAQSETNDTRNAVTQPTPSVGNTQNIAMTTTESTTESITLKLGNKTINTNLKSALDDIAPGQDGKSSLDAATYPPNLYHSFQDKSHDKNSSNVVFEVINVDPWYKSKRYNTRFLVVTSLYATLGLACILTSYCLVKTIITKRRRHHQYMLLTKRDMEFPLGGGGI